MEEQFMILTTYWVQAFEVITKLITRCGFSTPKVDPAIPGLTRPSLARILRHLGDPRLPMEARSATRDAIVKWLTAGDLLDAFEDDPQAWRFTAVLDLISEVHELTDAAHEALDRRHDLN